MRNRKHAAERRGETVHRAELRIGERQAAAEARDRHVVTCADVASVVDGIYPKGYGIGRVETADRGNGLYYTIAVRPSVDFSAVEEVLIVLTPARAAIVEDSAQPAGAAKPGEKPK